MFRVILVCILALLGTSVAQYYPRPTFSPYQPFYQTFPPHQRRVQFDTTPDPILEKKSRCYDETGRPQKCVPEFVNAAFGRLVEASNTCGVSRQQEYCLQTGYGSRKSCELCDAHVPRLAHPADYLTDFNNNDNQTWWQSETMLDFEEPTQINLTLNLGKAFDITYIRLFFRSPRPESFAIYKRSSSDNEWIPYQFYSSSCRGTYNMPDSTYVPVDDQTRAICTSEFSDISPLTEGNVAFSTLENRPSAYNFENSPELQEWVTATDIMIVLDNLNTFGDEVFGDPKVLKSYFFAITDLAVGGRCKCNGHASECADSTGVRGEPAKACICEHNTMGTNCEKCLPFYNDAPWGRATSEIAHECKPCNCNDFSNRCYFDQELYDKTGHGGHCMDCSNNRAGPNCERCRDDYHERQDGACIACNCNEVGSRSLQCGSDGRCQCKPGVVGDKCDRCDENHFDFGPQGCKPCGCYVPGSYENRPSCSPNDGICVCKQHVEGQQCDTCKPGYFNLDEMNEFGCTPCFCYGHSSICDSAKGYSQATIESRFVRGEERWKAVEQSGKKATISFNSVAKNIGVNAVGRENIYFSSPNRFLGNQRASYNHDLSFSLVVGELGPQSGPVDVILQGSGFTISTTIFAQGNSLPSTQVQEYTFRLHEDGKFGWSPRLSSRNFMALLSNLTAIKIRGTYSYDGRGFLDNVKLETTRLGPFGDPATWVETCTCPEGYVGQFCESCAPGYRHNPPNGGPFASCIPCDCNNHATICDSETGQCICQHNTDGNQCERCAKGFYGNALLGTPEDCQPCPCPNGGACLTILEDSVICLECPEGYTGPRCELCTDGFFGDTQGRHGAPRPCERCDCNGNIDSNAVSNCNRTTGQCLKCIYNTGGFYCDQCLPGFYGDALARPQGDCRPCRCNFYGTVAETYGPPVCDQISGQCNCKPYATGRTCDVCEDGFWNLTSGTGCEPCDCDLVGAENRVCDKETGLCSCRSGVVGRQCDTCQPYHYGFSAEGCTPCDCDHVGSVSLQCDATGQCLCRDNVEGRRCNRCRENTYDKQAGCRDCPPCYTLVLDSVSVHRERLAELERLLSDINNNPTVLDDLEFEETINSVMAEVDKLWDDAQLAASSGGETTVEQHLKDLQEKIAKVKGLIDEINSFVSSGELHEKYGTGNVTKAELLISNATEALRDAQVYRDVEGNRALDKAIDRSDQFGHQSARMSEIAREARQLAENHEDDANIITELAYDARNTSHDAHMLARKAIEDQNNITQVIKGLESHLDSLSERHENIMNEAADSLSKATVIYKEALNLSTEATNIAVPPLNATGLRERAIQIEKEAEQLKNNLTQLMKNREDLLFDLEKQLKKAEDLKHRGLSVQQLTEDLLARVFNAKKEADEAVKKADKTLEEAQNTLTTLEGFDQKVQASRGAAEYAISRVSEIENLINKAEKLTEDAKFALAGAESNAKDAKDIAQNARQTAEQASDQAGDVRTTADETKHKATLLKDEADEVAIRVAETEHRLEQFETQAENDRRMVFSAQEKANRAKSKAERASERVTAAYELVTEILHFLDKALNLDTDDLDVLERKLDAAYRTYDASDIEQSTIDLASARSWQQRQISLYEEELSWLRIEVDNIQEIKESLPDGCFRQSRIEP